MMRIVVNLCLTFCFLLEESSGGLNFTRLPGDPWVEDQENGSLPVFASCQALSPPSFKQPSWKLPCRQGQFRCADAPPCISMGKRCDGHTDCINGDDEPFSCSDPWVEDQENGSLPVLASCQELSPPSWQRVNSSADAPPHVWGSLHLTSLSRGKIKLSLAVREIQYIPVTVLAPCESSWQRVNSSADAPPRALSTSFVVNTTRPSFRIEPCLEKESRVERTLYVNTWLLIIILLLLALVLGKRVFKKVSSSWLKATHPKDVQGTRAKHQARTGGIEEDFTTDNTDIMHESALLLNYDDESPELNQQVCTAETKGACVHRGDLPFQVQGDLVVYMNMDTVNMNTMSMNMNTTNNVELQQNGGVTVVGDKTNINYHQPPQ